MNSSSNTAVIRAAHLDRNAFQSQCFSIYFLVYACATYTLKAQLGPHVHLKKAVRNPVFQQKENGNSWSERERTVRGSIPNKILSKALHLQCEALRNPLLDEQQVL